MVKNNIDFNKAVVLVTGAAGFIGSNLVRRLLGEYSDIQVVGIDSITDYYDAGLKYERLEMIDGLGGNWHFVHGSIADRALLDSMFDEYHFNVVVNLAAQAGVRYSLTNPDAFIESNIIGFYNILEACRRHNMDHLVYASSSYSCK